MHNAIIYPNKDGGIDVGLFDRILNELDKHRNSHIKVILPDRGLIVKQNYEMFLLEFDDVEASYKDTIDEIDISLLLSSPSVTCDDSNSLNNLIFFSNYASFSIEDGRIKIDLWFRLWEWIDK